MAGSKLQRLPVLGQPPPHANRRYLPSKVAEAPRPRIAVWEVTLRCDHRCLHCGPRAGRARDDELTTDECLRLIDELAEIGVGEVALIGGEAYLRDDFLVLVRAIRDRGMKASMTTGGWGLSAEVAKLAKDAGLVLVSVSIDGLEASHDRVRNKKGSWRRAFEALENAKAAGLKVGTNTQINAYTWRELPALFELVAAAGVSAWQIQFTMAHGNAADHAEILLQPYMLPEVFVALDRLADRCREEKIVLWPANNMGYFGPYEQKLRWAEFKGGHWSGCQAGIAAIGIESNGQIKGCPSLGGPTNLGGSWREHGLRALWERAPEIIHMRHRTHRDMWGYCADCYYAQTCQAGCTATSEPLLGRPGNNPFCHHRALEMDRMGLRERIEPVAAAPNTPFAAGLFRVIREPKDEAERARTGPVATEEPRTSRLTEQYGPGRRVDLP